MAEINIKTMASKLTLCDFYNDFYVPDDCFIRIDGDAYIGRTINVTIYTTQQVYDIYTFNMKIYRSDGVTETGLTYNDRAWHLNLDPAYFTANTTYSVKGNIYFNNQLVKTSPLLYFTPANAPPGGGQEP